jgi:hypothetical protein
MNLINDKHLINECNTFTRECLNKKMELNTICAVVKHFQQFYHTVSKIDSNREVLDNITFKLFFKLTDGFTNGKDWSGLLSFSVEEQQEFIMSLKKC